MRQFVSADDFGPSFCTGNLPGNKLNKYFANLRVCRTDLMRIMISRISGLK